MGNKQSGKLNDGDDVTLGTSLSSSVTAGGVPPRKEGALATWHRVGVEVTDVYEVEGVIGSGLMGEVYKVKRRKEDRGTHNPKTRAAAAAAAASGGTLLDEAKDDDAGVSRKSKMKRMSVGVTKAVGVKGGKKNKKVDILLPDEPELKAPPSPDAPRPKSILKKPSRGASSGASSIRSDGSISTGTSNAEDGDSEENKNENNEDESVSVSDVSIGTSSSSALSASMRAKKAKEGKRTIRFAREYACKTVSTSRVKAGQLEQLLNEIYVMRTLDHPYILRLYEVYQVKRKIWLITELCSGGDLTTRKIQEPRVTVILEQILRAVAYMHDRDLLHRDLKLENVMYESGDKDASIRLIDFGLCKTFDRAAKGRKAVGTAYTLSPEVAKDGENAQYTEKTEVWSIGIIAWVLLAGDFPFLKEEKDLKDKHKLNKLLQAKYSHGITWRTRGISDQAKDFVRRCFELEPEDRWTVKKALEYVQNTWMPALEEAADKHEDEETKEKVLQVLDTATGTEKSQSRISEDMAALDIAAEDIEAYCKAGLLKKTILTTLAHTMDRDDVAHLREVFLTADTEGSGTISLSELKGIFRQLDTDIDDETVEQMFTGIDQDKSGRIYYAEFLAALAESQGLVTMERLAEAFDRIDADGKGFIDADDLKDVLGDDCDEDVVDKMIEEADFKKNGQVDYESFLEFMFKDPETGFHAAGDVAGTLSAQIKFRDIATSSRSHESIRALITFSQVDAVPS